MGHCFLPSAMPWAAANDFSMFLRNFQAFLTTESSSNLFNLFFDQNCWLIRCSPMSLTVSSASCDTTSVMKPCLFVWLVHAVKSVSIISACSAALPAERIASSISTGSPFSNSLRTRNLGNHSIFSLIPFKSASVMLAVTCCIAMHPVLISTFDACSLSFCPRNIAMVKV